MIEIGKKIAELRKERHWTQEKLADKLHMSKQIISLYESGKRRPSYESLEELADIFNVDMSNFLSSEEQRQELNEIRAQRGKPKAPTAEDYAAAGIAARTVRTPKMQTRKKTEIDEIVDRLLVYQDENVISPDEQRLLDLYRLLTDKQKEKAIKIIDAIGDD